VWVNQRTNRLQAEGRQQLMVLWKSLEAALPGIMPPASPMSAQAIQGRTTAVVERLQKGAGR